MNFDNQQLIACYIWSHLQNYFLVLAVDKLIIDYQNS